MSIEEQGFLSPDIAAYIARHRAENQAWFGHAMDLNSIAQQLLLEFQVKDNQTLWAPPNLVPLTEAYPKGHCIEPKYAETEAEALAICDEKIRDGYGVEVEGPGPHWDKEEVKRLIKAAKA
jgi:hypothetical protein